MDVKELKAKCFADHKANTIPTATTMVTDDELSAFAAEVLKEMAESLVQDFCYGEIQCEIDAAELIRQAANELRRGK